MSRTTTVRTHIRTHIIHIACTLDVCRLAQDRTLRTRRKETMTNDVVGHIEFSVLHVIEVHKPRCEERLGGGGWPRFFTARETSHWQHADAVHPRVQRTPPRTLSLICGSSFVASISLDGVRGIA